MVLAVDVIDRHGPSSKMRRQLQPKKAKVRVYKPFMYIAAKDVLPILHCYQDEVL